MALIERSNNLMMDDAAMSGPESLKNGTNGKDDYAPTKDANNNNNSNNKALAAVAGLATLDDTAIRKKKAALYEDSMESRDPSVIGRTNAIISQTSTTDVTAINNNNNNYASKDMISRQDDSLFNENGNENGSANANGHVTTNTVASFSDLNNDELNKFDTSHSFRNTKRGSIGSIENEIKYDLEQDLIGQAMELTFKKSKSKQNETDNNENNNDNGSNSVSSKAGNGSIETASEIKQIERGNETNETNEEIDYSKHNLMLVDDAQTSKIDTNTVILGVGTIVVAGIIIGTYLRNRNYF